LRSERWANWHATFEVEKVGGKPRKIASVGRRCSLNPHPSVIPADEMAERGNSVETGRMGYSPQWAPRRILLKVQRVLYSEYRMTGSMAVLLIEDYEDDVFLFERALQAVCPEVAFQSVSDVETAQCYLRGDGVYGSRDSYPLPRLIFLDWGLPKLRGDAFLSWIKSHPQFSKIPVVVLTGDVRSDQMGEIVNMGASAVVVKSEYSALKASLRMACGTWLRCCEPEIAEEGSNKPATSYIQGGVRGRGFDRLISPSKDC
jgi:two-component system, response regulator